MSPDNYVQDPFFTQNYNRYSYAYNNPLVYNDPDSEWLNFVIGAALGGFSGWRIGKAQGATGWGMAAYIFGGAAIGTLTAGLGSSIVSSFGWAAQSGASLGGAIAAYGTAGAVSGAVSGAGFAVLAGGNVWEGMGKGALFGGIAGAAGGFSQHLGFRNALFDSDKYVAGVSGRGDGAAAIAFERSVPEVIVQGIKQYAGTGLRVVGNGLKILATVPLMTLAFVLTPTELGNAHRPDPFLFAKERSNIWPDEYGNPPNSSKIDWNKSDSELANELSNTFGDKARGPKSANNMAKKWFNEKRTGKRFK